MRVHLQLPRFWSLSFSLMIVLCWFLATAPVARAQANFGFSLESTYTVNGGKTTTVDQVIKISNKTPTLYVKQYALKITSGTAIKNVRVTSDDQVVQPNVVTTDNLTSIGITFPDKVVGEGKTRVLHITYDQQDASIISGKVLELYVPPLSSEQTFDEYSVTVVTPSAYGIPVRVTPTPSSVDQRGTQIYTHFNQVGPDGVAALFGSEQIFNLTLRYNLENTTNGPGLMQLALPPDTPHQRLHYTLLDPQPQKLEPDADGNWIATYQLPANSQTIVYATAQAKLDLDADPDIPTANPDPTTTEAQTFWESTNPELQTIAEQHTTPKSIYDYVVKTLTYGFDPAAGTPPRLGALAALKQPSAVNCQEFTDLFVALARANHIPARRLAGYAHTENSALRPLSLVEDILHAWPEYYDDTKHEWHQVDPTWGNTTGGVNYFDQFDLNHIVFAINGASSTLPYPAGSYKLTDQNTKDVSVEFGTTFPSVTPDLEVKVIPKRWWGVVIPGWSELRITNRSGSAWYNLSLDLTGESDDVQFQLASHKVAQVLPFQTISLPLLASSHQHFWPTASQVRVTMHIPAVDQALTFNDHANLAPAFISYLIQPAFLVGLGVGGGGLAIITGGVLVSRFRR